MGIVCRLFLKHTEMSKLWSGLGVHQRPRDSHKVTIKAGTALRRDGVGRESEQSLEMNRNDLEERRALARSIVEGGREFENLLGLLILNGHGAHNDVSVFIHVHFTEV